MNKDRLLMLADYLEGKRKFKGRGVPANKFDLQLFMSPYSKFDKKFEVDSKSKRKKFVKVKQIQGCDIFQPVECQTAGCAVGWAATIPEFNEQGFYLTISSSNWGLPIFFDDNNRSFGLEATKIFFELTTDEYQYFFLECLYNKDTHNRPYIVAKRIRKYLKDGVINYES